MIYNVKLLTTYFLSKRAYTTLVFVGILVCFSWDTRNIRIFRHAAEYILIICIYGSSFYGFYK